MSNISLGKFGENIAAQYLAEKGYKLLEKNFYTRFGEIDLIFKHKETIIFVEVKTRNSADFGYGEEAVTLKKINSLVKTAFIYLKNQKVPWQIDVVSILLKDGDAQIKHFPNIEAS